MARPLSRPDGIEELARSKMVRVLGPARAQQLFEEILAEAGLRAIASPDDLMSFARTLSRRPGFEGTVGTMLSVQAVIAGAR